MAAGGVRQLVRDLGDLVSGTWSGTLRDAAASSPRHSQLLRESLRAVVERTPPAGFQIGIDDGEGNSLCVANMPH